MKKIFCVIVIFLLSTSVYANEVIKIAAGDWEPFTSSREKNANIAEKIVIAALNLEGVDIKINYYPWKRSYNNVLNGKHVGLFMSF